MAELKQGYKTQLRAALAKPVLAREHSIFLTLNPSHVQLCPFPFAPPLCLLPSMNSLHLLQEAWPDDLVRWSCKPITPRAPSCHRASS